MAASKGKHEQHYKNRMSEQEKKIRKRVACEERAFRIVERLIDGNTTEEFLIDAAQMITPEHYTDIVVERAIDKLCGYPICPNNLQKILKQKYHISTKTNKVYDISDRKNFCSNWCYKASKFFQKQISAVPVWAREEVPRVSFILLKDNQRGSKGEAVISPEMFRNDPLSENISKSKTDDIDVNEASLETLEIKENSTGEDHQDSTHTVNSSEIPPDTDSIHTVNSSEVSTKSQDLCSERRDAEQENIKSSRFSNFVLHEDGDDSDDSEDDNKSFDQKEYDDQSNVKVEKLMTLLDKKKNKLSNMVQLEVEIDRDKHISENRENTDTKSADLRSVYAKENSNDLEDLSTNESNLMTRNKMMDQKEETNLKPSLFNLICNGLSDWITERTLEYLGLLNLNKKTTESLTFEMKYKQLCENVSQQEVKFGALLNDGGDESSKTIKKPVPDFQDLKKMEDYELKVGLFLKGTYTYKVTDEKKDDNTGSDIILPTVDSHDQLRIRQKIVMDRLNKIIPDLLPPLRLSIQDVFTELRELVSTFSLSSENIMYKPAEWTFVGLLLLKLLTRKIPKLEEAFKLESAIHHFTVLLRVVNITLHDLEQHVCRLCKLEEKSSDAQELD